MLKIIVSLFVFVVFISGNQCPSIVRRYEVLVIYIHILAGVNLQKPLFLYSLPAALSTKIEILRIRDVSLFGFRKRTPPRVCPIFGHRCPIFGHRGSSFTTNCENVCLFGCLDVWMFVRSPNKNY